MADQKREKTETKRTVPENVWEVLRNFHTPEEEAYRAVAPWAAARVKTASDYYRSAYSNYSKRRKKSSR